MLPCNKRKGRNRTPSTQAKATNVMKFCFLFRSDWLVWLSMRTGEVRYQNGTYSSAGVACHKRGHRRCFGVEQWLR